jgi:hypothetical protein
MSGTYVHSIVGATAENDFPDRLLINVALNALKGFISGRAEQVAGTLNACGPSLFNEQDPAFLAKLTMDTVYGNRVANDVAVSAYSQSGGLASGFRTVVSTKPILPSLTCSLFGEHRPESAERLPNCIPEDLETEAGLGRYGAKHLVVPLLVPLPGRGIYESQAVALKVANLLDMSDPKAPLDPTHAGGYQGQFRLGFPPVVDREVEGCFSIPPPK